MIDLLIKTTVDYDKKSLQKLEAQQARIRKNFLRHAGGYVRKVAKRSLRKARKIRVSELPDDAQEQYKEELEDFRAGHRPKPPVLRDIISSPGQPPLLHMIPSPVRNGLKFEVDEVNAVVIVGGVRSGKGVIDKIEQKRPFIKPAYDKTFPLLPAFFRNAVQKG